MRMYVERHRLLVFVVAVLALVLAMSTSAWALGRNSVTSKTIKNGQVKSPDLAQDSVTSAKVRDGAIAAEELGDGAAGATELAPIVSYYVSSVPVGDSDGTTNGGGHGTVEVDANCPADSLALSGGARWVDASSGSIASKNLYVHSSFLVGNGWRARGTVDIGAQGTVRLQVQVNCLTPGGTVN